jgi:hypothetical protein
MNFLKALQHAFIGYGIRRKSWDEKAVLYFNYDKDSLHFLASFNDGFGYVQADEQWEPNGLTIAESFLATDWEAI